VCPLCPVRNSGPPSATIRLRHQRGADPSPSAPGRARRATPPRGALPRPFHRSPPLPPLAECPSIFAEGMTDGPHPERPSPSRLEPPHSHGWPVCFSRTCKPILRKATPPSRETGRGPPRPRGRICPLTRPPPFRSTGGAPDLPTMAEGRWSKPLRSLPFRTEVIPSRARFTDCLLPLHRLDM